MYWPRAFSNPVRFLSLRITPSLLQFNLSIVNLMSIMCHNILLLDAHSSTLYVYNAKSSTMFVYNAQICSMFVYNAHISTMFVCKA